MHNKCSRLVSWRMKRHLDDTAQIAEVYKDDISKLGERTRGLVAENIAV